ncbi:MAG: hypothetical protein PHN89_05385 [Candidatus Pacebacteria bacterium]|nr:hypothetical protein [Candidatus Paceibacterota bacterium]
MKYKLDWLEKKETKVGPKFNATITDEKGATFEGVTLWLKDWSDAIPGMEVEGELTIKENGQYTNKTLYRNKTYSQWKPKPKADMTKLVEMKDANITKQVDRKEDSIKMAGSIRDAVSIVVAKMQHRELSNEEIELQITLWVKKILNLHEQPFI